MTEITEANLFSFPSSDGLHTVAGYRFPVTNPRAVVQISHGMIEHVGHYTPRSMSHPVMPTLIIKT